MLKPNDRLSSPLSGLLSTLPWAGRCQANWTSSSSSSSAAQACRPRCAMRCAHHTRPSASPQASEAIPVRLCRPCKTVGWSLAGIPLMAGGELRDASSMRCPAGCPSGVLSHSWRRLVCVCTDRLHDLGGSPFLFARAYNKNALARDTLLGEHAA